MSSPTDTLAAHPVAQACAQVNAALDLLGEAMSLAWSACDGDLVAWVRATDVVMSRTAAVQAELIAECAARDLPKRVGATSGTSWLAGVLTARPGRASSAWRLATDLASGPAAFAGAGCDDRTSDDCPGDVCADATVSQPDPRPHGASGFGEYSKSATSLALAAGPIDVDQAAVIAKAVIALPAELDPATRVAGERYLLEHAAVHHAGALAHLAERLLDVLAPDLAEERLGDQLARDEARAGQTSLTASDDRHGMVAVRGRFDIESWAVVAAALDPLAAPRPSVPTADHPVTLDGAGRDNTHLGIGDSVLDPTSGRDTRPQPRRMADALIELARRSLDAGTLPTSGGTKPHVVVTIDHHALATQVGAGLLDTGQTLSVRAVRRLSCDALVTTILRDRVGQPLDVGRTQRLFPSALRRALIDRDRGCAFPGCTRPPSWCDAHHIVHWADGGPTSLDNGVLLCGHHHRYMHAESHRDGWSVSAVAGQRPVFIPPAHVDPYRRPRHNTVHLRL